MITPSNLTEHDIAYIAMAIDDIIQMEGKDANKADGLWLEKCWLTPESCYCLKKLLDEAGDIFSKKSTRDMLQAGTNVGLK